MTSDAISLHDAGSALTTTATPNAAGFRRLTHRYVSLALRCDYLSAGAGHQQSRRTVKERLAGGLASGLIAGLAGGGLPSGPKPPRRSTDVDAGRLADRIDTGWDDATPAPDCERRYLAEIASKPRLTSREEYGLVVRMRRGDRAAYEALIEANLGLVVMVARRYQRHGIPLTDVIAEGNFGLMRAAGRFDPEVGCRFGTYAKWWVRQSIQLALPKLANVVRVPLLRKDLPNLRSALPRAGPTTPSEALASEAAEVAVEGTAEEIAEETAEGSSSRLDADRSARVDRLGEAAPVDDTGSSSDGSFSDGDSSDGSPSHGSSNYGAMALDGPAWSETNDPDLLNAIAIDPEREPPGEMMAAQRLELLRRALDALDERDRFVIAARYALGGVNACTLGELAARFGVSIERVRQIENAAVKKLAKWLHKAGESAASLL